MGTALLEDLPKVYLVPEEEGVVYLNRALRVREPFTV